MIGPDTDFQGEVSEPLPGGPADANLVYHLPQDVLWSRWDMLMGIVMGIYMPLNRYARNDDCFSMKSKILR